MVLHHLLLFVPCTDPTVETDLRGRVLANDVDGFKRDLKLIQQKKPLSTKQIKLVQSYIAKVKDKKKREDFNDVLFSRDNVSARDYNLWTPPMDHSTLVSLPTY